MTPANLGDIPDIVHWSLANADAFRIVSFLPVADVGRTEDHTSAVSLDRVWDGVCAGIGRRLNRRAILFGHPECNITVPLIAISGEGALGVVELVREGKRWDAGFAARSLERLVPHYDFNLSPHRNFPRLFSRLILNPMIGLEAVAFVLYRLWGLRSTIARTAFHTLRGSWPKIRPLLIVVHSFMSRDDLQTTLGRERLEACVFKLPVDGRLVSMCEMNATNMRRGLNLQQSNQSARARSFSPQS